MPPRAISSINSYRPNRPRPVSVSLTCPPPRPPGVPKTGSESPDSSRHRGQTPPGTIRRTDEPHFGQTCSGCVAMRWDATPALQEKPGVVTPGLVSPAPEGSLADDPHEVSDFVINLVWLCHRMG